MISPEEAFRVLLEVTRVLDELDVSYVVGGSLSERQWNDILGGIKVQGRALVLDYLEEWAERSGIEDLLAQALTDSRAGS